MEVINLYQNPALLESCCVYMHCYIMQWCRLTHLKYIKNVKIDQVYCDIWIVLLKFNPAMVMEAREQYTFWKFLLSETGL